jgi:peptide/nickel transport system substrate-binding protein
MLQFRISGAVSVYLSLMFLPAFPGAVPNTGSDDLLTVSGEIGRSGGTLTVSLRSEPKTLNPLTALDIGSKTIINLMQADLVHINRYTQRAEPALAKSWTVSPDGRRYTLCLRSGLHFSDGSPCTADDVVFSFRSYLDENVHSPQRDLLIISGKPLEVQKTDDRTVVFTLADPYAAAERLFDCVAILPRHLLQESAKQGKLGSAWGVAIAPDQIAGMGPFRLRSFVPGERIVLERNPYYWKKDLAGNRLPYLDEIVSLFAPNADAEAMRFEAGETDIINGLSAADFAVLMGSQLKRHYRLYDLGPGPEYDFLFFNQNPPRPDAPAFQLEEWSWFKELKFRKAVSDAIDRQAIVHIAFQGRASPISGPVTPGDKLWSDASLPHPKTSLAGARQLLGEGGFIWAADGLLHDSHKTQVRFSLAVNAGNPQQVTMATLIQQDLRNAGIEVALDELDFHTFLNRIFETYNYDAAIIGLAAGDFGPNPQINVLSSDGSTHVWCLSCGREQPAWQVQIDQLMQQQLTVANFAQRKRIYDEIQELIYRNVPVIFLVAPNVLVGAKERVGNFRPAVLSDNTLWNAEQLFLR